MVQLGRVKWMDVRSAKLTDKIGAPVRGKSKNGNWKYDRPIIEVGLLGPTRYWVGKQAYKRRWFIRLSSLIKVAYVMANAIELQKIC